MRWAICVCYKEIPLLLAEKKKTGEIHHPTILCVNSLNLQLFREPCVWTWVLSRESVVPMCFTQPLLSAAVKGILLITWCNFVFVTKLSLLIYDIDSFYLRWLSAHIHAVIQDAERGEHWFVMLPGIVAFRGWRPSLFPTKFPNLRTNISREAFQNLWRRDKFLSAVFASATFMVQTTASGLEATNWSEKVAGHDLCNSWSITVCVRNRSWGGGQNSFEAFSFGKVGKVESVLRVASSWRWLSGLLGCGAWIFHVEKDADSMILCQQYKL